MIRSVPGVTLISLALAIAGCERGTPAGGNETNSAAEANAVLEAAEENAAALAQDDELANQAAADEAADMAVFGGNAAAGEGANSPPELPTDGNTTP